MALHNATGPELEQLTARVFDTRRSGARLNAYRIDDTFYIDVDLPGADPAGIDVAVDRGTLTIRCERKQGLRLVITESSTQPSTGPATGPSTGPVTREVPLSDTMADALDTDRLDARYENGVLTLSIPVAETATPRHIGTTPGEKAA
jgi:HSP20 family protein